MSNLMARVGTPGLVTRMFRGNVILHAQPDFEVAAGERWQNHVLDLVLTDRFFQKQGRSIARWTLPGMSLYLKRHYVLPWWHALAAILFPRHAWSPGLQEWHNLHWAMEHDIRVPRPAAAAEWRGPGLKLQSFLAVDELTGMIPLHEAIPEAKQSLSARQFAAWKRRLIPEIARLAAALHKRDRYHKDLYFCHFYVLKSECQRVPGTFSERVVMIDFHRMARHTVAAAWHQAKDLAQLLYSTRNVDGVDHRDVQRFWKHYRARVRVRKNLRWLIRFKDGLYRRHARRVAARKLSKAI
jgi:hypothetical protein